MLNGATLVHALAYSAIFAAYALVTLTYFPRLWLRHYPDNERSLQPPRSRQEKIYLILHVFIFLGVIVFALPVISVLIAYNSNVNEALVFRHIVTLGVLASLVDWLILDWLLLRYLQPQWLIPAETQASSWRSIKEVIKDFIGFVAGCLIAVIWGYAVSRFLLT